MWKTNGGSINKDFKKQQHRNKWRRAQSSHYGSWGCPCPATQPACSRLVSGVSQPESAPANPWTQDQQSSIKVLRQSFRSGLLLSISVAIANGWQPTGCQHFAFDCSDLSTKKGLSLHFLLATRMCKSVCLNEVLSDRGLAQGFVSTRVTCCSKTVALRNPVFPM